MEKQTRLAELAYHIRCDVVRMLTHAGSGHLGGSLSCADILAALYGDVLRYDVQQPHWEARDRFILSIGHVAPAYYATLARVGFFPVEQLATLRQYGSRLQGHPSVRHGLPGVDVATGSLGQGLGVGVGAALAARLTHRDYHTYVLLGDGELQEGSVWEAAMSASFYKLTRLTALVDRNRVQIDGANAEVMALEPLEAKWRAFGWQVLTLDGHDLSALAEGFRLRQRLEGPCVLICNTEMGHGIARIAGDYSWHGKVPTDEQMPEFLEELARSYREGQEKVGGASHV